MATAASCVQLPEVVDAVAPTARPHLGLHDRETICTMERQHTFVLTNIVLS